LAKIVFASLIMGGVCYCICSQVNWLTPGISIKESFGWPEPSGVALWFSLELFLLRCPELETLKDVFKKKMTPPSA